MTDSALVDLPLFGRVFADPQLLTDGAGRPFDDLVQHFCQFGQASVQVWEGDIRYLINEFWTAGRRQAHSIHEVSYRACFKPQLPEFFISRLTKPGDAVYDPFMGRGTTPVQAALMGRRPIGNDINPVSVLLGRPRLAPPALREVARKLDQISWDEGNRQSRPARFLQLADIASHLCTSQLADGTSAIGLHPGPH
jgi:hypothetical protein